MIRAYNHREHLSVRWGTSPFATDVKEDRTIVLVEELVIVPVPLLICSLIAGVKVVNLVFKVVSVILIHRNAKMLPAASISMKFYLWRSCRHNCSEQADNNT